MRLSLRDIADVQIGYQGRGRIVHDPDGRFHVLQMRDLDDDGGLKDPAKLVRMSTDREEPDRYAVGDGDVLFQARGNRNRAFVLRGIPPATLASNHFYILRKRLNTVLLPFLAWSVNQPSAQAHLSSRAQGTTIMLVPKEAFESLEIDVPPPAVQQTIVELARLREQEKALLRNLESKRDILLLNLCLAAARHAEQAR